MKVTKINAVLIIIYCIFNVIVIGSLNKSVNELSDQVIELHQERVSDRSQLDATSELLLAHVKLHYINKDINKNGLIFPKIMID